MTTESASTPLRQWRVTITEDRDSRAWAVHLSWRTFPCPASRWDAHKWFTVPQHERAPIVSLDALRALLGDLGEREWTDRPTYR